MKLKATNIRKGYFPFLLTLLFLLTTAAVTISSSASNRNGPLTAYLVQGDELTAVIAAVESVNGTITHELNIINAVGANLSAPQLKALQSHPDINRLVENQTVTLESSSDRQLILDSFNSPAYYNNNGTVGWSSEWLEEGEDDGPAAGVIQIVSNDEADCDVDNCLRLGGSGRDRVSISRAIVSQKPTG